MTVWIEGNRGFFLGAAAQLVEDDREVASWASPYIVKNPAYKWVLGRFVEADRANINRQLFSLDGLQMGRPSIAHAPMNMNHVARRVVGAFVGSDLIYPTTAEPEASQIESDDGQANVDADPPEGIAEAARDFNTDQRDKMAKKGHALPDGSFPIANEQDLHNAIQAFGRAKDKAAAKAHIIKRAKALGLTKLLPDGWTAPQKAATQPELNPYIEALGVFWKYYFPDEYELIENAYAQGALFYSMECVPGQIQCAGAGGCGGQYEYAGRQSDSYCAHLNDGASDKLLIDPHFTGGALLVPPVKPGWANADVHSLVAKYSDLADRVYAGVAEELPGLSASKWEAMMEELLVLTRR